MDASTRWETEAIRSARRPQVSQKRAAVRRWATLREAAEVVGVPVGTVRSWAKTDEVPSYLQLDDGDARRMVDLDAVQDRAAALGRTTPDSVAPPVDHDPDAGETGANQQGRGEAGPEQQTMIVPIDAWNKMLNQLGNLHEAGQQLAEARERAARAETEVIFLRRRLKELREEMPPVPSPPSEVPPPTAAVPNAEPRSSSFFSYIYRGWRSRRSSRS